MIDLGLLDIIHTGTDAMIPDYLTKPMTGVKLHAQVIRAMYHGNVQEFVDACERAMKRYVEKNKEA
jgi:hypothetical protein